MTKPRPDADIGPSCGAFRFSRWSLQAAFTLGNLTGKGRGMVPVWMFAFSLLAAGNGGAMETANRSDYISGSWAEVLRSMDEPPLPELVKNDSSVFRAIFNMDQDPDVFRIETYPDGRPAHLTHVAFTGGYGLPLIRKKVRQRELTANELARFRESFARVSICGSPLRIEKSGLISWNFEFANATRYCAIERWPESRNDPSAMLGALLRKLAE